MVNVITHEAAVQVIGNLLKRTPMNDAEALGAQCAINLIVEAGKELAELKNPRPAATD